MGLSSILRDITGMFEVEKEVENLQERIERLEKEKAKAKRVHKLERQVRELQPVNIDLTNRERQILEVFLESEGYIDVGKIAEDTSLSRQNAGSHLSNLKKKIDFDSRTLENNRKEYRLSEEEENKILGKR